jgi:hypothetical protein
MTAKTGMTEKIREIPLAALQISKWIIATAARFSTCFR